MCVACKLVAQHTHSILKCTNLRVSETRVSNLKDLKTLIEAVIKGISEQLLEGVVKNVHCCCRECIESNGAHLQNVVLIQKMKKIS